MPWVEGHSHDRSLGYASLFAGLAERYGLEEKVYEVPDYSLLWA
jgi:hypothetical protein